METVKIDSSSLMYRLAYDGGFRSWSERDICTFRRAVMWGASKWFIFTSFVLLFYILTGYLFVDAFEVESFWLSILVGALALPVFIGIMLAVVAILIGIFKGFEYLKYKLINKLSARASSKPEGAFRKMYNSWKEKHCVKIEIVDGESE